MRKNVQGTQQRPRLSVFRSLSEIYAQVIDDRAGHTLVSASTIDQELRGKMKGLKKSEQAKLVGKMWLSAPRIKAFRRSFLTAAVSAIAAGSKPWPMAPVKAAWNSRP